MSMETTVCIPVNWRHEYSMENVVGSVYWSSANPLILRLSFTDAEDGDEKEWLILRDLLAEALLTSKAGEGDIVIEVKNRKDGVIYDYYPAVFVTLSNSQFSATLSTRLGPLAGMLRGTYSAVKSGEEDYSDEVDNLIKEILG